MNKISQCPKCENITLETISCQGGKKTSYCKTAGCDYQKTSKKL